MSLDAPTTLNIDGSGLRFAIIAARFNQALVDSVVHHTTQTLAEAGAPEPMIERVPGSNELPAAAALVVDAAVYDAIIVIGVVIAGSTHHHHTIGDSTAVALHQLSLQTRIPIINGILVVENLAQAEARCGTEINRGKEFALAALEMAQFKQKWTKNPK